jgi:predicted DsbA family dithiol-disulfide isomerase
MESSLTRIRYGDSEEKMKMYTTLMSAYGASAGIDYKYGGTVANSLQAHRVIQYFQEEKGPEVADKLINALYRLYFEEERHPSSEETLLAACTGTSQPMVPQLLSLFHTPLPVYRIYAMKISSWQGIEAGITENEAKKVIEDKDEGLQETKMKIREQASNGVDSVPFVVFEGKRRDITIQGANEVEDYVKALEKIVKESS